MGATRAYDGNLAAGATAASVPLTPRDARPVRENAFGQTLTDGPYQYIAAGDIERVSVAVEGADAEGVVTLQGCNGNPATSPWYNLGTVTVDDGETGVITAEDLSALWLRVRASGAGATVSVELVASC
jgi:hypothetical protein